MRIHVRRVYDQPEAGDGVRVLVDRLWPRGLRKETAAVDHWFRELAPSTELRRWFGHDPDRWEEFRRRYAAELDRRPEILEPLLELLRKSPRVTLLYAAKDEKHNNAVALAHYLDERHLPGQGAHD